MIKWQGVTLQDVVTVLGDGLHGTPAYDDNGEYYFVNGNNLSNGKILLKESTRRTTEEEYLKYKKPLNDRTILLSINGTLGNVALYNNEKCFLGKSACYFNIKEDVDKQYIRYVVTNKDFQTYITEFAHGTTIQNLSLKTLREFPFELPPIEEQKAIASVLRSLDDKIDLLHHQNTTLERMAETLFRQWFIEEVQEDWEFVELGEYVECFNGVSYKSSELNPSKVAMVTLKSFDRNGGFRLDGFKEFTGRFKEQHVVIQGDLVVAHTDITQGAEVIGNPVLVVNDTRYEHMVISMDLVKVKPKYEWLSNEFLYRMMRTREFKEHCLGYSNGSTVLHLSKQAIPTFEFFMPPKEKIKSYTKSAKDLFAKKFKNIEQIQTLEKLRDNLLPKLMSGEVRVAFNGGHHDAI